MDGAVMSAMSELADPRRVWTIDELYRWLPENVDPRCFEIVDGALIVSPPADFHHEFVIDQLRIALRPYLPADLWVGGPAGVDLAPSYRVPDLVVVSRELITERRKSALAAEVSLAVEVVSPSSRSTDRIMKPAQYAAAGIGAYWRVETEPDVTLTAYALDAGADVYTELGSWGPGQVARIERPFPVDVPIDSLIPTVSP
jgi:Uma2 family endonuclease